MSLAFSGQLLQRNGNRGTELAIRGLKGVSKMERAEMHGFFRRAALGFRMTRLFK
jgi:hypothetical protein